MTGFSRKPGAAAEVFAAAIRGAGAIPVFGGTGQGAG